MIRDRRIAILGSCVTRDPFALAGLDDAVKFYGARWTIASLTSAATDPSPFLSVSKKLSFFERCLKEDFNKSVFARLKASDPDVLLIDFIEQRHSLARINGTLVTYSTLLRKHCLERNLRLQILPALSPEVVDMSLAHLPQFCELLLSSISPETKTILHEAYWATEYLGLDGQIERYEDQGHIRETNTYLTELYSIVCNTIRPTVIRVPEQFRRGVHNHIWTNDPFHFNDQYSQHFMKMLEEEAGSGQRSGVHSSV